MKRYFTKWELGLWLGSCTLILISYLMGAGGGVGLVASLVGVTALIFYAKGNPVGQALMVVFCLLYAWISYSFRYYGELLTYMGMTFPMAVLSIISWARNPYKDTGEVAVAKVKKKSAAVLAALTCLVTVVFYYIMRYLGTENLPVSTMSIATSFLAAGLTFLRSPYYALWYCLNDIVLIVLWVLAAFNEPSYSIMVMCFVAFLANDLYAFFNWRRMRKRQAEHG